MIFFEINHPPRWEFRSPKLVPFWIAKSHLPGGETKILAEKFNFFSDTFQEKKSKTSPPEDNYKDSEDSTDSEELWILRIMDLRIMELSEDYGAELLRIMELRGFLKLEIRRV